MSFKQPKESINKNSPRYQQQLLYLLPIRHCTKCSTSMHNVKHVRKAF